MSERILLLEDERNVGSTLLERFKQEGFDVSWAQTIEDARLEIGARKFDLALLDVGLPDGSGFSVAQELRLQNRATAIVFLTAFGSPEDRVKGLELGAEDYVVKPFHLKELLLRVRNALKRASYLKTATESDDVQVGRAMIRFSRYEAELGGESIQLTHKECALLRLLVQRRGKPVSREEILREVWAGDESPTSRTIDNFIMKLRRVVERDPNEPKVIKSIRGVGYQLEPQDGGNGI